MCKQTIACPRNKQLSLSQSQQVYFNHSQPNVQTVFKQGKHWAVTKLAVSVPLFCFLYSAFLFLSINPSDHAAVLESLCMYSGLEDYLIHESFFVPLNSVKLNWSKGFVFFFHWQLKIKYLNYLEIHQWKEYKPYYIKGLPKWGAEAFIRETHVSCARNLRDVPLWN